MPTRTANLLGIPALFFKRLVKLANVTIVFEDLAKVLNTMLSFFLVWSGWFQHQLSSDTKTKDSYGDWCWSKEIVFEASATSTQKLWSIRWRGNSLNLVPLYYQFVSRWCFLLLWYLVVYSLDSGSKSPGARPGWVIVWCSQARDYSLDRLGLGFLWWTGIPSWRCRSIFSYFTLHEARYAPVIDDHKSCNT